MTTTGPSAEIERQTRALLDLVQSDGQRQIHEILDAAQRQAAELQAQARAQARARMRQTYAEQRRLLQEGVSAAQARLATQRRRHAQQRSAALLQLAWAQLPQALQARWQQPASRAAWVARVVAAARAHLPRGAWQVVHPADWPAAEQQALAQGLAVAPRFEPDARLPAGLKIAAGGAIVDGTLAGLLADRTDLEARLLRLLEPPA
jgi:hypothetical protein